MSKRKNRQIEPVVTEEETVIEPVVEIDEPIVPAIAYGVVCNCYALNIRQEPSLTANVVDTIAPGSKVEIELTESNDDFYRIRTSSGCEGYCAKEYISITE